MFVGERIAAVGDREPIGHGALAGFGERDERESVQAEIVATFVDGDSLNPGLDPPFATERNRVPPTLGILLERSELVKTKRARLVVY